MSLATVANLRLKSPHKRPVGPPKARGRYQPRTGAVTLRIGAPVAPVGDEHLRLLAVGAVLPDEQALLPVQFVSDPAWSGQKRLMAEVLRAAVRSYQYHPRVYARTAAQRRLAEEAGAWLRSDDMSWPFSFVNICDALGLDVGQVRVRVMGENT